MTTSNSVYCDIQASSSITPGKIKQHVDNSTFVRGNACLLQVVFVPFAPVELKAMKTGDNPDLIGSSEGRAQGSGLTQEIHWFA